MLRRLLLALSLSTAIVSAGAGTATAGPALAAIGAFAATPIGGVVVNLGVGLIASGVSSLIDNLVNPDQNQPTSRAVSGYSGTVPTDPTAPIGFVMGTKAVAGTIVYRGVWGSAGKVANANYVEERILSDVSMPDPPTHLVLGKKRHAIDWDAVPVTQGYPIPGLSRDGKVHAWARYYSGSQTVASAYMRGKFGDHPDQPYTATMVGRGQAKLVVTFRANPKLFKTGFPDWMAEVKGIAMYNIAKDTTAGGSGTHRINDPATWEPSNLLPVHIFNTLLGVRQGDEWVWGGQDTAASQLPAASWIAAIAEANTTVAKKGGGTEKQFVGGMEIAGDMEPAAVIEHQLRGCSGRFAEMAGIYKMICGLPASPVMTLTDADIIVSRPQSHEPFPRPEATFNAIQSKYWENSSGWQLKDAPERKKADWIEEDGGYRPANVTYEAVNSGTQVQRLNTEALLDSRRWAIHGLPLPPKASELELLDMVALESDRWGYDGKTFLLEELDDEETFEQFALVREVDPADHGSYDPDVDEEDMVFPSLDNTAPAPEVVVGYSLAKATMVGDNGAARPTFDLTIPGGLDDVAFIRVTVRRASGGAQVWTAALPYKQGLADGSTYVERLGAVLLPSTAYQVLPEEIPISTSRDVVAGAWLDETTDAVGFSFPDLGPDIAAWQQRTSNALREVRDNLARNDQLVANAVASGLLAYKQIREEMAATSGDLSASYLRAVDLLVTQNSVIAQRAEIVEAAMRDPATGLTANAAALSSLSSTVSSQGGQIAANSSAITAVQAQFGNSGANAVIRMDASYSPSAGYDAAIAIMTSVSPAASPALVAGIIFESKSAGGGSARAMLLGDQVVVANGGVVAALFEAGTTYLAKARIHDLDATNITAAKIDAALILQNGTTITALIATGAVTDAIVDSRSSGTLPHNTSLQTILSISVTAGSYPLPIGAYIDWTTGASTGLAVPYVLRLEIVISGNAVVLDGLSTPIDQGTRSRNFLSAIAPPLPAGTYTVRVRLSSTSGDGSNPHTCNYMALAAGSVKK